MTDFSSTYEMTIGGRGVTGTPAITVVNPATDAVIATVGDATREELDAAVAAARAAFPAWKVRPHAERQKLVTAIGGALAANADALARLLTQEQGKPHGDAMFEIMGSAMWCQASATMELPVTINEDSDLRRSETRHVPLGVVGAIVPWNFPMLLAIFKIAPALLAGNTIVVKPSPFTPLTMMKLGELLREVLPAGVMNVVTGGDHLGPWITEHPDIQKVSFTGSTATGRRVMASAAATLKRITLELGGNDAAIVMPDIDIAEMVEPLFWAAFRNSGQLCIATKRMYVHDAIYDEFAEALVAYARGVRVGDGAEQGTNLGPVQNRPQFDRVKALIGEAHSRGERFLIGGDVPDAAGLFVPVAIVDNPPRDSRTVQEEAFGPVLPLLRFSDADAVIDEVNDSEYGLGASIWTKDLDRARALAARIEAGTVWINEIHHLSPLAAFAGHKQSGFGTENGMDGLLEYTVAQTIVIKKTAQTVAD